MITSWPCDSGAFPLPKGKSPGKVSLAGAGALGIKLKATISAQSPFRGGVVNNRYQGERKPRCRVAITGARA